MQMTPQYTNLNCTEIQNVLTEELHHLPSQISRKGLRMRMCLFRKGWEKEAMNVEVLVNNQVLDRHDDVKYQGVIAGKQLNWKRHIESVRRK